MCLNDPGSLNNEHDRANVATTNTVTHNVDMMMADGLTGQVHAHISQP